MKAGVITFPGSNCDRDIVNVLRNSFQVEVKDLWHKDHFTEKFDLLVVPGGFSYGDYLRAGAIARFTPAMQDCIEYANKGGNVLGICNGFQILCEARLLPGALLRNVNLKHICKDVHLKPNKEHPLGTRLSAFSGKTFTIPISHGDGNYRCSDETLATLKENNQILFQYQDNPNGALEDIAGISNDKFNVIGMMPHPERAVDPSTGGTDGKEILGAILSSFGG